MEEGKSFKVRMISGLTAMGIAAGGYAISSPINAYAEMPGCCICNNVPEDLDHECDLVKVQRPRSKYGVTVDEETGIEYNTVVVEKGDNASTLSSRAVHYFIENNEVPADDKEMFNEDYDTRSRYWPVIVYLNTKEGCEYHSTVGEKFKFPKTYDELVALNAELKRSGWFANYVQNHGTYKVKKVHRVPKEKTRRYIEQMYREVFNDPCFVVDDAMLNAYLNAHGYEGKFVFDKHSKLDKKEEVILSEWIPTCDELEAYMPKNHKKKVRK